MILDVTMPKLSLGMMQGTVVEWYVRIGDRVQEGMPLAALETDKLTTELEAPASGIVVGRFVEAGASVLIGAPLASIDSEA